MSRHADDVVKFAADRIPRPRGAVAPKRTPGPAGHMLDDDQADPAPGEAGEFQFHSPRWGGRERPVDPCP